VYDSVYEPGLGGGGGSLCSDLSLQKGGLGGGVVEIDAGELELAGEIRARGETRPFNDGSAGAGGTVRVRAGTLLGSGLIDVSGGDTGACSQPGGVGGGGRVSLLLQTLSGFDPAAQVKAWSGERQGCGNAVVGYGAPGTIFVSDSTSTYGRLLVDSGQAGAVDRTGLSTELPVGPANGLDHESVVGCDNVVTVPASALGRQIGRLLPEQENDLTAALHAAFDLDDLPSSR